MPSTPKPNAFSPSANRSLADRIRGCTRCPDLVRCRNLPVPGIGPEPAQLMIVGLAPGRRGADRTGTPFLGDLSGGRLRRALGEAARSVFITNVVKCAPKACGHKAAGAHSRLPARAYVAEAGCCIVTGIPCRPKNRDPAPEEIQNCAPYLAEELRRVRPVGILTLGRVAERAVQELLGRDVTAQEAGELAGAGPFVAYLPHPAALHYHPAWSRVFEEGLATILQAAGVTGSL